MSSLSMAPFKIKKFCGNIRQGAKVLFFLIKLSGRPLTDFE